MIADLLHFVGSAVLIACNAAGSFAMFLVQAIKTLLTTKLRLRKLFSQMEIVGVNSLTVILLTGISTGAVLAYQSYIGFKRYGSEDLIGPLVALSMTRELGPVLTGLMVTGRAGSAMAAEIGSMKITEQIDALKTLCINVFQYLIVPRVLASVIILPFLSLISTIVGIVGGYFVCVNVLNLNGEQYITGIKTHLELADITGGMIKASVFGLILSWVGTYKGIHTQRGSRGVGLATTQSVVLASMLILISNYFLASMLFPVVPSVLS